MSLPDSQLLEIPNHIGGSQFGLSLTLCSSCVFISFLLVQLVLVVAQDSKSAPPRVRYISEKLSSCPRTRKVVITLTVGIMVVAQLISSMDIVRAVYRADSQDPYILHSSQYLGYIWIISIISLSTFIKLHYLYKAILLGLIFFVYTALIVSLILLKPQYNILLTRPATTQYSILSNRSSCL